MSGHVVFHINGYDLLYSFILSCIPGGIDDEYDKGCFTDGKTLDLLLGHETHLSVEFFDIITIQFTKRSNGFSIIRQIFPFGDGD